MVELASTAQLENFSSLDSLTFLSSSSSFPSSFLSDDSVNDSSSFYVSNFDTTNFFENESISSNSSNSNEDLLSMLNVPYTIMEALVAITAIIGNALVIIVFYRERRLRRRTNYYIISLALADFLVGLLGIPFAILASVGLPKNLYACLLTTSSLVVLCTISIFCLLAVSIDRYWAILHPLAYSRNVRTKTAIGIISVCWFFGSLVGFLPVFGWHNDTHWATEEQCFFTHIMDYNYLVFLYFATIITPSIVLIVFYGLIYRVILRQVYKTSSSLRVSPSTRHSNVFSGVATTETANISMVNNETHLIRMLNSAAQKREVKATQNLSIIVAFFLICWVPLYTINCVNAFCNQCFVNEAVTYFAIILSHLNSAINPLLYAYHLKDFRGALWRLITCTNDQNAFYRPSLTSQYQQRINNHYNSTRNQNQHQNRMYIDSPVWRREQQFETAAAMASMSKGSRRTGRDIMAESGKGKKDKELVKTTVVEHQKSDYENFNNETIELQASALYRIASATTKAGARNKNEIV